MNCKRVQRYLAEHLDGSLSGHLDWEIERHLVGCRECSRAQRELELTLAAVRGLARPDTTPDLRDAVRARLNPSPLPRVPIAGHRPAWPWALAAAALCLAAWGGLAPHRAPSGADLSTDTLAASARQAAQAGQAQSVALAASNPLDDVAAANLVGHASAGRGTL